MNIRVKNLVSDVSEQELREAFEEYGKVASVSILKEQKSKDGRKETVALVEMPSEEEAGKAVLYLDGIELRGKSINVLKTEDDDESLEDEYSEYEDEADSLSSEKHTKWHENDLDR